MRALFLLLVLANVLFYAWRYGARPDDSAQRLRQLEIAPERIRLLRATRPSAAPSAETEPRSARPAPVPALACLEWGLFTGPAAARAAASLAELDVPAGQVAQTVVDDGAYWVHMPPQRTRADAERKVGELKALGVTEFFVVQDPPEWRFAISLGLFRSEAAAQAHLAQLRKRGVRTAVIERRADVLRQTVFHVREPDAALVARLTELQRDFPGTELKAGPCPGTAAVAGR